MSFPLRRWLPAVLAAAVLAGVPSTAWALPVRPTPAPNYDPLSAPTAQAVQSAVARLTAIQAAADRDVEAYDAAQAALQQDRAAFLQQEVDAFAVAEYSDGTGSLPAALVASGGPGEFVQRLATLQQVSQNQGQLLDQLSAARRAAHADELAKAAMVRAAADKARALAALTARIKAEVVSLTRLVKTMKAAQLAAAELLAEAGPDAAARAELPKILRLLAHDVAGLRLLAASGVGPLAATVAGTYRLPDPGTAKVLALTLAQLGKPYKWAAAGPKMFDCSGLTMWLWSKVGRALPHNAAAQYDLLPHVALNQMAPGDLVFYSDSDGHGGTYVGHVGVYIGFGEMIDAPHTGSFVRVDKIWPNVVGAARVP